MTQISPPVAYELIRRLIDGADKYRVLRTIEALAPHLALGLPAGARLSLTAWLVFPVDPCMITTN